MLYTSNNGILPLEILNQVFRNLVRKEDIKICLLVCKSWKFVAQEFFDRDISIIVKEKTLDILLDDLSYFGQNVRALKMINIDSKLKWIRIISLCPHITAIYCNRFFPSLFEILQDRNVSLNNLQRISVSSIVTYGLKVQDLYLRINTQYRETITSLELCSLKEEPTTIKYSGLVKFISQFPRLTCLKVNSFFTWTEDDLNPKNNPVSNIDIKRLLEEAPQLKEVKLYRCAVTSSSDLAETTENTSLIKLKIIADTISFSTLKYIAKLLKRVETLRLIINSVTADEDISEDEYKTMQSSLETRTSEMKSVKIQYEYKDQKFHLDFGNSKYMERFSLFSSKFDDDKDYDKEDFDYEELQEYDNDYNSDNYDYDDDDNYVYYDDDFDDDNNYRSSDPDYDDYYSSNSNTSL